MNRATWNAQRALVFARGLYHIAACDGLAAAERSALAAFLSRVGLPFEVEDLGDRPFDNVEAAAVLDSTWLRRMFIQGCRLMVQMDGQVSPAERDLLRNMAVALSVGERVALDDLEGRSLSPQALVDWISEREVDFVSWDDDAQQGYFWAFPHPTHPLAAGGRLSVAHGQALVVLESSHPDARATDVLPPGEHEISPETLPGLAALTGWRAGPVEARLLFVRTGMSGLLRWGTTEPVVFSLSRGLAPIRAFGRFAVRFDDPKEAVKRFARQGVLPIEQVEQRLGRIVSGRFAEALNALSDLPEAELLGVLQNMDELRERVLDPMKQALAAGGLGLARFMVENLTSPLELGLTLTSKRTETLHRVGRSLLGGEAPPEPPRPSAEAVTLKPCTQCFTPVASNARFCPRCGKPQRNPCVKCGMDVPAGARFCPGCGGAQSA